MPTTYTHRGIVITFDEDRAEFTAAVRGHRLRAPSLDAMKVLIDTALEFAAGAKRCAGT